MTAKELAEKIAKSGAVLHGDRVLVAREKSITKTKSGLYLPPVAQERQSFGVIVMKGTDFTLPVEIGDSVYVAIYGGVVMRQPVGDKVYALEALHSRDIYITWKAREDVELEEDADEATEKEATPRQARTLRNQW